MDVKQIRLAAAGAQGAAVRPPACSFIQASGHVRPSYLPGGIEGVAARVSLWAPETMLGKDNQIQE